MVNTIGHALRLSALLPLLLPVLFVSNAFAASANDEIEEVVVTGSYPHCVIFLLDNGQIWIQDVFRYMAVDEGDAVTIKRARMGGYIMTTERGASTRVQRIR